ncbi:cell division control protein 6 homolog [Liolophura sinensis]|uniref:cell division control protein 6 homolog n=1 Tax=Liolophura sinensis TaxID=3198878 RepID=UPI0031581CC4
MSTRAQRKLDFPVRKSTRSQRKLKPVEEVQDENSPLIALKPRTPRKRTKKSAKDVENEENVENICVKPVGVSPSKKKKESRTLIDTDENLSVKPVRNNSRRQTNASPSQVKDSDTPVKNVRRLTGRKLLESPPRPPMRCLLPETPKTPKTVLQIHKQDSTPYQKAKKVLHTAKPDRLVCREKETEQITEFLEENISGGSSGSLYISGAPGTGKTAVLTTVIDKIQKKYHCKTVYVNCMTLKDSQAIFSRLASDITGKQTTCRTAKDAMVFLEKHFTSKGSSIILVLDEIDQLDSKRQNILYTMFEWPALPKSRLVLIGIANALDLTDRILPRLQARPNCKPKLLNFTPYTKNQIVKVLQDRLEKLEIDGTPVMEPSAVQFCARKVSAVAGDMRKALDVCRRAVEMVEKDVKSQSVLKPTSVECNSPSKSPPVPKKIGITHIASVVSEVYDSKMSSAQQERQTIPLQQKLAVCTMLLLSKEGKFKEVTIGKLQETYNKLCKRRQVTCVDQSEFFTLCDLIASQGILAIKKGKEARLAKVSLKYDEQELEHALQDKLLISSILQQGIPK